MVVSGLRSVFKITFFSSNTSETENIVENIHYSILQFIALHDCTVEYITLLCSTVHYSILQYIALHYSTVHYITLLCSTVQYCQLFHF